MNKNAPKGKVPYESETSIFAHPNQMPKAGQPVFPTWFLIVALIASFFILKGFIYLKDEKRHGR